jgi:hypothetical protein
VAGILVMLQESVNESCNDTMGTLVSPILCRNGASPGDSSAAANPADVPAVISVRDRLYLTHFISVRVRTASLLTLRWTACEVIASMSVTAWELFVCDRVVSTPLS